MVITPFFHVLIHLLISLIVFHVELVVLRVAISTQSLAVWVGASFDLFWL
jgi:hypothetical protein